MRLSLAFLVFLIGFSLRGMGQQPSFCLNDQMRSPEIHPHTEPFGFPALSRGLRDKYVRIVVYVIYFNLADDVSDEEVESLIDKLNRVFRAENVDTSLLITYTGVN